MMNKKYFIHLLFEIEKKKSISFNEQSGPVTEYTYIGRIKFNIQLFPEKPFS